ncbi:apolipoprotein L3-like [Octodon degus]|uniref:Apolipoprotein L3-like n=1 Tax=Octodon degus TaxID=10160 RepID=A0A6P3VC18_OCTDE|nr:apolipoprotein L3-like [Octodon degus]
MERGTEASIREEAEAVREALIELTEFEARERFLNAFPHMKKEMEEGIAKLYALAEKVDKVHKDCTITNVVAGSGGAVSGILTILGLALAPVTAGGSLVLSATGLGLGAAAAVTGVSASIVDFSYKLSAKAEAKRVQSGMMSIEKEDMQGVDEVIPKVVSVTKKFVQASQNIEKNIHAMKVANSNPRLLANAKRLMRTGKISVRRSKQVQRSFRGTVLSMSKHARITGAATAGVFLLMDVYNLVQDSVHLHTGAKTEEAAQLRQQAQDLERKLEELIQIHESLQQDLTL